MRLFLALLPDDKTKGKLYSVARRMKELARKGNFTATDNLHLTLVFLGEIEESALGKIIELVEETTFEPFVVKTRNLGFFSHRGAKDVLVWHLERSSELVALFNTVRLSCEKRGFTVEDREYRPHFTIARKVVFPEDFAERHEYLNVPVVFMKCERLSLMESLRVNDRIMYRELHGKTMVAPPERRQ